MTRGAPVHRPVCATDRAYLTVVRPAAQHAIELAHHLRGLLPTRLHGGQLMDPFDHARGARVCAWRRVFWFTRADLNALIGRKRNRWALSHPLKLAARKYVGEFLKRTTKPTAGASDRCVRIVTDDESSALAMVADQSRTDFNPPCPWLALCQNERGQQFQNIVGSFRTSKSIQKSLEHHGCMMHPSELNTMPMSPCPSPAP